MQPRIREASSRTARDRLQTLRRLIDDEIVRNAIRDALAPPVTRWQRFSSNQTINRVLGFFLTALVGGILTQYYTARAKQMEFALAEKQKQGEQARSFLNALNEKKLRESLPLLKGSGSLRLS